MFIPKNHDKLHNISEEVRESLGRLDELGVPIHSELAGQVAADAIRKYMPELVQMRGGRVAVEAEGGLSVETVGQDQFHKGLHVAAMFSWVRIQQLIENIDDEGLKFSMATADLCAVVTPVYLDPEPQDIVFGKELYVPFGGVTSFEPALL